VTGLWRNVTFPARQFIVHGDKRNFALLRAIDDPNAQNHLRDLVLIYAVQAHEVEAVPNQADQSRRRHSGGLRIRFMHLLGNLEA
jgi:hypothetical protein